MAVSGVGEVTGYSSSYQTTKTNAAAKEAAPAAAEGKTAVSQGQEEGVVLEKGAVQAKKPTYSANKMSDTERANLISKMKADAEDHKSRLLKIAQDLISGQTKQFGIANAGDDSNNIWNFLRKGDFTVDAATKKQAQEDISENGYFGVKQTSERLFDFAKALSGGDVDKMKEMQEAIEKGYKQAEEAWGGELPDISKQTLDATNKMFEEYYKAAGVQ